MRRRIVCTITAVFILAVFPWGLVASGGEQSQDVVKWDRKEIKILKSLWLGSLPPLPDDPSNAYDKDPRAAVLGEEIFYDTRFSADGKVACSNCHFPTYSFTDDLPLAKGMGTTARRSMPFIGLAYSRYFFWDGRKDSLWSQALGPPESPVEHGISRTVCVTLIYKYYRPQYEAIFGAMPKINEKSCPTRAKPDPADKEGYKLWQGMTAQNRKDVNRVFANMGKAIAAFVGKVVPAPARFDHYIAAVIKNDPEGMGILSRDEQLGLKLYLGKGKCINCHSGPLLTNGVFHNMGVSERSKSSYDRGRGEGIKLMQEDEFNCRGEYSDADPKQCRSLNLVPIELRETKKTIEGSFKTPSLRNVAAHPPYMHDGSLATFEEVMVFYLDFSPQFKDVKLDKEELQQLEALMLALNAPLRIMP